MRNLMIITGLTCALGSIQAWADDSSTADSNDLCTFDTIATVQASTLEDAVSSDDYSSLSADSDSSTCNTLIETIGQGSFAVTAQKQQATTDDDSSSSTSSTSSSDSGDDSSYYYSYLQSQNCSTPTSEQPLTQNDLANLSKYSRILAQAAIGCEATYYKAKILESSGANSVSSTQSLQTMQPSNTSEAPRIQNRRPSSISTNRQDQAAPRSNQAQPVRGNGNNNNSGSGSGRYNYLFNR